MAVEAEAVLLIMNQCDTIIADPGIRGVKCDGAELAARKIKPQKGLGCGSYRLPVAENQSVRIFEDGRQIGVRVGRLDEVAAKGQGRIKAKEGRLYFSRSDGTAPESNGRRYTFDTPVVVPSSILWGGRVIFGRRCSLDWAQSGQGFPRLCSSRGVLQRSGCKHAACVMMERGSPIGVSGILWCQIV